MINYCTYNLSFTCCTCYSKRVNDFIDVVSTRCLCNSSLYTKIKETILVNKQNITWQCILQLITNIPWLPLQYFQKTSVPDTTTATTKTKQRQQQQQPLAHRVGGGGCKILRFGYVPNDLNIFKQRLCLPSQALYTPPSPTSCFFYTNLHYWQQQHHL